MNSPDVDAPLDTTAIVDELTHRSERVFPRDEIIAAIATHLAPGKVHVRFVGSRPTGQINPNAVLALTETWSVAIRDGIRSGPIPSVRSGEKPLA